MKRGVLGRNRAPTGDQAHGAHFARHRQILAQMCLPEHAHYCAKCVTNPFSYTAMLADDATKILKVFYLLEFDSGFQLVV